MAKAPASTPKSHVEALPSLRSELEEQLDFRTTQLERLTRTVAGDLDDDGARDEVSEAQLIKVREVLAEIHAALTRMDEGGYGTCQGCFGAIPLERLEIMPYVRYCVTCGRRAKDRNG